MKTKAPAREACHELLTRYETPDHIRAHSEAVARVSVAIGEALNAKGDGPLDIDDLLAGALLHDIMKMHSIVNGGRHAELGEEVLLALGLPKVAEIVLRHVDIGDWDPDGPVTESEIVNYADKRVKHDQYVSLDVRFDDLMERYGVNEKARARITGLREQVRAIENKIFQRLGVSPEDFAIPLD